jgi:hypothetical protein
VNRIVTLFLFGLTILCQASVLNVPLEYQDDIKLDSPAQHFITIKDRVVFKGRVKSYFKMYINGEEIELSESGKFNYTYELNTLGKHTIRLEFKDQNNHLSILRHIIKFKNPGKEVVSQESLALLNTEFFSQSFKKHTLSNRLKRKDLAYFLNKVKRVNANKKLDIKNINYISLEYQDSVQAVVNNTLLTLDSNGNFKQNSSVKLLSLLVSICKVMDYKYIERDYPELKKYKDKWMYKYLSISIDNGLLLKSELKQINRSILHATFLKVTARIPEIESKIISELKFTDSPKQHVSYKRVVHLKKPVTLSKRDNSNTSVKLKKTVKLKKSVKLDKHDEIIDIKDIAINIIDVVNLSNSRKRVQGKLNPIRSAVVNWKRVEVDSDGRFDFIIPNEQHELEFKLLEGTIVKSLKQFNKQLKGEGKKKKVIINKQVEHKILPYQDLELHWIASKANALKSQGKLEDSINFYPNKRINRVEFAKLLVSINGLSNRNKKQFYKKFTDIQRVKVKQVRYIDMVVSNKLMRGVSNTQFGPELQLNKLQAIVASVRLLPDILESDRVTLPYKDIEVLKWAYRDLQKAYYYKVISHAENLYPSKIISKAECVSLLYKISHLL